jgi:hypothetical protein
MIAFYGWAMLNKNVNQRPTKRLRLAYSFQNQIVADLSLCVYVCRRRDELTEHLTFYSIWKTASEMISYVGKHVPKSDFKGR